MRVKAKKHLGQHFLTDTSVAERISNSIENIAVDTLLEIGPGTGVLTQFLLQRNPKTKCVEVDVDSVAYLAQQYPDLEVFSTDFLQMNLSDFDASEITLVGNFPYNISSQIVFKALENRGQVVELTGMFQKEVAERICAQPKSKAYGIVSVVAQAYYNCSYLFTVPPHVFNPPPKVQSGVLRMQRYRKDTEVDYGYFLTFVKTAFGQRRKKLRNCLAPYKSTLDLDSEIFQKRAEELDVNAFIELARLSQ